MKQSFNKDLEIFETLKHLRSMFNGINPHKLAKVVYEAYIVFLSINGFRLQAPDI
jgi:hypothetical protein